MSNDSKPNYYNLLQVDPSADATEIRYAFRNLAGKYHPSIKETGNAKAFKEIVEAFRVLADSSKRDKYDRSIGIIGDDNSLEE